MDKWTAEAVKTLRAAYGDTQARFAERLRVATVTLKGWESGKARPPGPATIALDILEVMLRTVGDC